MEQSEDFDYDDDWAVDSAQLDRYYERARDGVDGVIAAIVVVAFVAFVVMVAL